MSGPKPDVLPLDDTPMRLTNFFVCAVTNITEGDRVLSTYLAKNLETLIVNLILGLEISKLAVEHNGIFGQSNLELAKSLDMAAKILEILLSPCLTTA